METLTNPGQMPLYMPGANANIAGNLGRIEEGVEALTAQFERMSQESTERDSALTHRVDRILGEQAHLASRMGRVEAKLEDLINGDHFSTGLSAQIDAA